jgi:hypothetical protein
VAYKNFVAGEEALAADVNNYLMGQTVARFASAAARTSGLPAPVVNQLSMLDTRPGITQYWNGSAWADDAPLIRTGFKTVTTDSVAQFTLAYGFTFPAAPAVFVIELQSGASQPLSFAIMDAATTTTQTKFLVYRGAAGMTTYTFNVIWLAVLSSAAG